MAYYPDLGPCTYFSAQFADKLVAVGWLDAAHPYTTGSSTAPFLDKLFMLLAKPWAPMYLLGYADCPFCTLATRKITYNEKSAIVGALNLFVPSAGFLYAAPSLIAHYILDHQYAPPPAFCAAVLDCPPMASPAYFQAIRDNGPQRFGALIDASV